MLVVYKRYNDVYVLCVCEHFDLHVHVNNNKQINIIIHIHVVIALTVGVLLVAVERNTQPRLWHVCRR